MVVVFPVQHKLMDEAQIKTFYFLWMHIQNAAFCLCSGEVVALGYCFARECLGSLFAQLDAS